MADPANKSPEFCALHVQEPTKARTDVRTPVLDEFPVQVPPEKILDALIVPELVETAVAVPINGLVSCSAPVFNALAVQVPDSGLDATKMPVLDE